jgi:hypothetical protein
MCPSSTIDIARHRIAMNFVPLFYYLAIPACIALALMVGLAVAGAERNIAHYVAYFLAGLLGLLAGLVVWSFAPWLVG